MDPRVTLLKAFYAGLPADRVKLEGRRYGFDFLERVQAGGARLDYGQLTLSDVLHKYKFSNVPAGQFDEWLHAHVRKEWNVCLYFGGETNDLFCFNLDNNFKTGNTAIIPEMAAAVRALRACLAAAGCEPLIVASGRGYHAWCRLAAPVGNRRLHDFMIRCAACALAAVHRTGGDTARIKFNFYPDIRTVDTVSLRLFGTEHAKNRVFSRILAGDTLLDEEASWAHFEAYARTGTLSLATFDQACAKVVPAG